MTRAGSRSCLKTINPDTNERYTRLFSAKDGTAEYLKSGYVVLGKAESIGEHSTGAWEEVLIIIEGKGRLILNKFDHIDIEKNRVLYIGPNTIHDVHNTGAGSLRYIYVTSPAGGDDGSDKKG